MKFMKNLVNPSNKSFEFFKRSWNPCVLGAMKYLLKHPLTGPLAIWRRLRYPILKRNVTKPFITPEGFRVETNKELLTWAQMFIEKNLYSPHLMLELTGVTSATIVDVGANHGMATAYFGSFNNTNNFICIEPYEIFLNKGIENTRHLRTQWINAAASSERGSIAFYRGGLTSCKRPALIEEELKVDSITLDDLQTDIFLLKIDTDGHSNEVLSGAVNVLRRTRHVIIEEEDGLDLARWFPTSEWSSRKLPSGCDMLFTNLKVPIPRH